MALQLQYSSLASPGVNFSRARSECGLFFRGSGWGRVSGAQLGKSGGRIGKNGRKIGKSLQVGLTACASSRGDFELGSEEILPSCEHSNLDLSDSRRRGFLESWMGFFGDFCESFCSQSPGDWRRVSSAALLCSAALVTAPSLATPDVSVAAVQALPASDFVAAAVTLAGALGILQFFDELAKRDLLEKKLSRKLCHILSGMVFMLFWPLFSAAPLAKYLAAFAPAANGLRMIGLGLGLWKNEALVKAISREGSQSELLRGPLYYAITITVATLFFWRNSPVGACAVATLCAGDGFADIVGREWGKLKLPYNNTKSVLGSVAFFVMASLACMGYVAYFSAFGFFTATPKIYLASVVVAFVSAIAESLPLPLDDNFTVPFTAIGIGMLLLPV